MIGADLSAKRAIVTGGASGIGQPEDFAEVILFLCAGGAYVSGQTIRVDGGFK